MEQASSHYTDTSGERVRPLRLKYVHNTCKGMTRMGESIAETYARHPAQYKFTYCVHCRDYLPVGEFVWDGTAEVVGS